MSCLPLLHKYRIASARFVRVVGDFNEYDATHVLRVCVRCGKPRTREVKGSWTLADLTAPHPPRSEHL